MFLINYTIIIFDIDHRITFDNVVKGSVCDSNSQPPPSSPLFLITETPLLSSPVPQFFPFSPLFFNFKFF